MESVLAAASSKARRRLELLDVCSAQPPKLNVLNARGVEKQSVVIQDLGEVFYEIFDPGRTGIVGPRFEAWLRIGILSLVDARGSTASILDVPKLFTDHDFLREMFPGFKNPLVVEFWTKEMAQTSDYHKSEMLGWFASKFERFRSNPIMSSVLSSGDDSLDFAQAMDRRKVVLISLPTAEIGDVNARLLGYLFLSRIWTGALSRKKRTIPFTLYVDEYQSFTVSCVPRILAEGRKFGLRAVVAHQFVEQLGLTSQAALRSTVGNRIAFRGSHRAVDTDHHDEIVQMAWMPNFHAFVSLLNGGIPTEPFTIQVPPPNLGGQKLDLDDGSRLLPGAPAKRSRVAGKNGRVV